VLQKDAHRIGRDEGWSDVEIPGTWEVISRRHATLRREGNSYRIMDGDGNVPSRNGIWVNNITPVGSTGYLLKHGERLTIGKDMSDQVSITYFNPAAAAPQTETKVAE
jgi:pSer/pThr/pTyr-binding forkhead associated (FHA) protein